MDTEETENNMPEIEIEVEDRGMNTDKLEEEELEKLIKENPDLKEEEISPENLNILHEAKDPIDIPYKSPEEIERMEKTILELKSELREKENQNEQYQKVNEELKNKIQISSQKLNEIMQKIKDKEGDNIEESLTLKIKELEKEIEANNIATERIKKEIDGLKNKIEFKSNIDKAFNLQSSLKQEMAKNTELKNQIESLSRVSNTQKKYINNYDQENQISKKLGYLKNEIKNTKDCIKDYQERFTKQDKFIKLVHEKILMIEMNLRKRKEPKVEKKKLFSKEDLKNVVDSLKDITNQIKENRDLLNSITKSNDDKIHQFLAQNKKIEASYKENEKLNKNLIFKKNELKRAIKK